MANPSRRRADPEPKQLNLALLYPLIFVAVYVSHGTLLRLPYFWDEAGYYIPAALDFFHTGTLIPQTTLTNAHPPLPSILLAGWWRLGGGPSIWATRTLVCMVSAAALLGIFRLARGLAGSAAGVTVTLLTAVYPVFFAQSTLAHADSFAVAFTLWAISFYLVPPALEQPERMHYAAVAILFSLAALAKETAIVTPAALALWELILCFGKPEDKPEGATHLRWVLALAVPLGPLAAWYAYHYRHTGFIFGNPEFLRYNATANLSAVRILLSLWHRLLHLTMHMNMYVPVVLTLALLATVKPLGAKHPAALERPALPALTVILLGNWVALSILGGALLTRYLLPMFPLVLLLCCAVWVTRLRQWWGIAALTGVTFVAGLWINPPYAFAPEDNLTYRDMIVLHQQAIGLIEQRFPLATVLTAWPASAELTRPELGYVARPFKVARIENFSLDEIQKAAADPGGYDTMLIFSTKLAPAAGAFSLSRGHEAADRQFFDFHRDVSPAEAAAMLHGDVIWQASRQGEWAAVLRFPRSVEARAFPFRPPA